MKTYIKRILALLCGGALGLSAYAQTVPNSEMSITTSMTHLVNYGPKRLHDGVVIHNTPTGQNLGFLASGPNGVINVKFNKNYNVNAFTIWNNVGINSPSAEGVEEYYLKFYSNGSYLGFEGPFIADPFMNQGQTVQFPVFSNVDKVEMVIMSAYNNKPEIREIAFGTEIGPWLGGLDDEGSEPGIHFDTGCEFHRQHKVRTPNGLVPYTEFCMDSARVVATNAAPTADTYFVGLEEFDPSTGQASAVFHQAWICSGPSCHVPNHVIPDHYGNGTAFDPAKYYRFKVISSQPTVAGSLLFRVLDCDQKPSELSPGPK